LYRTKSLPEGAPIEVRPDIRNASGQNYLNILANQILFGR
jgi:hypothetical protein